MDNLLIDEKSQTTSRPVTERRRPGRVEHTDKALIALLRNPTAAVADDVLTIEDSDVLAPTRGILIGLPIGMIMWCAIGLAIWQLVG